MEKALWENVQSLLLDAEELSEAVKNAVNIAMSLRPPTEDERTQLAQQLDRLQGKVRSKSAMSSSSQKAQLRKLLQPPRPKPSSSTSSQPVKAPKSEEAATLKSHNGSHSDSSNEVRTLEHPQLHHRHSTKTKALPQESAPLSPLSVAALPPPSATPPPQPSATSPPTPSPPSSSNYDHESRKHRVLRFLKAEGLLSEEVDTAGWLS